MPLDPAIPLSVTQPHIDTPVESQSKVLGLKSMQNQIAAQQQEAVLRQQAVEENTIKLAAAKRQQAGVDAIAALTPGAAEVDPETGESRINHRTLANRLDLAGFPELAASHLEQADRVSASEEAFIQKRAAHRQAAADLIGEHALSLQQKLRDPNVTDAAIGVALTTHAAHVAGSGLMTEAQARAFIDKGQNMPRDQFAQQLDDYITPNARQKAATLKKTESDADKAAAEAENIRKFGSATPPSTETKSVLLDGKPAELIFNPRSQRYQDADGNPIANAATRVKPIPPASIQVNTAAANALANLPAWATDASRPSGPDANKLDRTVRMTPNGLYQAALTNIATGQFPQTGRGNDPAAQAVRAAVTSKVGAIAAESGMDEPALRAFYKANSASLTQTQKSYDAVQSFMSAADKNAALLQTALKKVPDTGIPIFNQPLRTFEKNVAGNPDLAPFATYLRSVTNEYGKIIAQPNLSGQLTDSARKEAEDLLDPKATVKQILATVQALTNEGTNRLTSLGDQIRTIQQRMSVGAGGAPGSPKAETKPPAAAAPKVGDIKYLADGSKVEIVSIDDKGNAQVKKVQ